jgi:hypothetical protein
LWMMCSSRSNSGGAVARQLFHKQCVYIIGSRRLYERKTVSYITQKITLQYLAGLRTQNSIAARRTSCEKRNQAVPVFLSSPIVLYINILLHSSD